MVVFLAIIYNYSIENKVRYHQKAYVITYKSILQQCNLL